METRTQLEVQQGKLLRQEAGRWLRQLRQEANLTQRDLAERVGLRYYTFVSQIEAGQGRIPPDQCKAWAEALGQEPAIFAKTLMKYYDPVTYGLLFPGEGA